MIKPEWAFPSGDPSGLEPCGGLTKREYFAAMAMQGLLASGDSGASNVAKWSVGYATALLAALDGGGDD